MKKNLITFLFIAITGIVIAISFSTITDTKQYIDLKSVITSSVAQAESGYGDPGWVTCKTSAVTGSSFYKRECVDCKVHWTNWKSEGHCKWPPQ